MSTGAGANEIVLVVDDEEQVRQTVEEWLAGANLGIRILTAADSAKALLLANEHTIDLAILDWNLGAGLNGLDLLQDLSEFHPDVIAIMMTAFADQATPLDAMRKGVRDYLDKNQEFKRENFLASVTRQLQYIRPAKRERRFHQNLLDFRNAVEKALPDVECLAALHDPVPLPQVVRSLFRFMLDMTRASDGVLFIRQFDADKEPAEFCRVFDVGGEPVKTDLVPFAQSIAAGAVSMEQPRAMIDLQQFAASGNIALQPYEEGRASMLAAPLNVGQGIQVVLELFDKKNEQGALETAGFNQADIRLVRDAGQLATEMLRQALAQRQTHQVLLRAVEAALAESDDLSQTLTDRDNHQKEQPPPNLVLERMRESLGTTSGGDSMAPADSIRLAEAIRILSVRHGPRAVKHCIDLVESLREVLDEAAGLDDNI